MVFTSDIILRGSVWDRVVERLLNRVFKSIYGIFLISSAIGIAYDKRLVTDKQAEEERTVPRTVLIQPKYSQKLEVLFQSAIVSTTTEPFNESERLKLAFGEEKEIDYNKVNLLVEFANFGITVLDSCLVEGDEITTIENIKNTVLSICKGENIDIILGNIE